MICLARSVLLSLAPSGAPAALLLVRWLASAAPCWPSSGPWLARLGGLGRAPLLALPLPLSVPVCVESSIPRPNAGLAHLVF